MTPQPFTTLPSPRGDVPAAATHDYVSIQALRALAATMVVVYHVKPRLLRMGWTGTWPEWLGCGVDIFFVISGVIMWVTTSGRAVTPGTFMLRRFLRIAPLYYLVTALVIAIIAVAPSLSIGGNNSLAHIAASFGFLPARHPVLGTMEPVLPQGWTLNYEMEFYLLFAASLALPRAWRLPALLLALAAIAMAGFRTDPATALGFATSSIILEFGFGLLIGAALMRGVRPPIWAAGAMLVAGIVAIPLTWPLVAAGTPRVWLCGTGAALLVAGAVFLEAHGRTLRSRIVHRIGDASYSIYLTHGLAMSAVGAAWARFTSAAPESVRFGGFVPVAIAGALLTGIAVYLCVERPVHRWTGMLARRRSARPFRVPADVRPAVDGAPAPQPRL